MKREKEKVIEKICELVSEFKKPTQERVLGVCEGIKIATEARHGKNTSSN